jgi:hypothetical protein
MFSLNKLFIAQLMQYANFTIWQFPMFPTLQFLCGLDELSYDGTIRAIYGIYFEIHDRSLHKQTGNFMHLLFCSMFFEQLKNRTWNVKKSRLLLFLVITGGRKK